MPSVLPKEKVVFFTGKGGVGKSTLSLSLAQALVRENKKVAVVNFHSLPEPFSSSDFDILTLDLFSCFKEYVLLLFKSEIFFKLAFDSQLLHAFLKTTPGVKETLFAGKIYHLAKNGGYDHLLVDLPSFGHAYSFFKTVMGVQKLFRIGFVEKEINKVAQFFQSPEVRIDFVTLLEELPAQETKEFKIKFEKEFPFHLGQLWLNRVYPNFQISLENKDLDFCVAYKRLENEQEQLTSSLAELNLPVRALPFLIEETQQELVKKLSETLWT